MKKLLIATVCSLALLPSSGAMANSLDSLFGAGNFTGPCGQPPALNVKDVNFCGCLLTKSTEECKKIGQPAAVCSKVHYTYTHIPNNNYSNFCRTYSKMFPKDASGQTISLEECTADLAYYNAQCK